MKFLIDLHLKLQHQLANEVTIITKKHGMKASIHGMKGQYRGKKCSFHKYKKYMCMMYQNNCHSFNITLSII